MANVEPIKIPKQEETPRGRQPSATTETPVETEKIRPARSQDDNHSISHSSIESEDDITPVEEETEIPRTKSRSRSLSRISSVQDGVVIIPRLKRRGLLGQLALIPEVATPQKYTRQTKWLITLVVSIAGMVAPLGSAIFFPSLPELSVDLNASKTITNLSVAMYMLSMSIFPLWWSSFSETLGRRTIYMVSFTLFTIFAVLCAISTSISMLVVMRILSGGAAASVQAVGAGTIADIWESRERGRAMGIFYLGPLMGPLFAPIIGGALSQHWGWRSTQWFLAIWGGMVALFITFCLPETLARPEPPKEMVNTEKVAKDGTISLSRVSTRQSVKKKSVKTVQYLKRSLWDPITVLAYLRFPPVALTVYYAAITFGGLYVLNVSLQQTFSSAPYNFSTLIVGLMYIPNSLGYIVSSIVGGRWSDSIMIREAKAAGRYDEDGNLIFLPEDRMRENAYIAAVMYPLALILYGWAAKYGLHWMVAATGGFFFGVGSMIIFSVATTMLTEFMPKKSSSGVAINNFVRNIFSCVGGIVTAPLIDSIGNGWLFTILGLWALASGFVVYAMRKFGPRWRADMQANMQ